MYSVKTEINAAAIIPYKGIKNKFKIMLTVKPIKVTTIFCLYKPNPFSTIPVRLFKESPIIAKESILSIKIELKYFSV